MKNVFIDSQEIYKELHTLEQEGANFALKLSLLAQKIKYIFIQINECSDQADIDYYFLVLDSIQTTLGKLSNKYEIGLPDRLARFVHDFDNLEMDKDYYQKKIKRNEKF
jgi:hypothetical protein